MAPMGLEDLQLATYGAGGPPKGLEDLKSGSRSQEVLQQAGGPPMDLEDPKSGSMGQEDLQWVWRTPSQVLWGRRTSNGSGGPPTALEDLQQPWRTSNGSGGPPMDLEDPKSGSMGQKVLQQPSKSSNTPLTTPLSLCLPPYSLPSTNLTGCTPGGAGPPRLLLHPNPGSMGLEDLQSGWRTSNGSGGPQVRIYGSRGHLWGRRSSNSPPSPLTMPFSLSPPIQSAKHQSYRL